MEKIVKDIFHALVITIPTENEIQFVTDKVNGGKSDNMEKSAFICAYLREEGKENLVLDILDKQFGYDPCERGQHDPIPILGWENAVLGDQCRYCGIKL